MKISVDEYRQRRKAVLEKMADNSIAIIPASTELRRSRDTEFPFRQDSDFHYLTGFPEPDAFLVLEKSSGETQSTLICRIKDKQAEIWQGRRIGKVAAKEQFGFDNTYELDEIDSQLLERMNRKEVLYFAQGEYDAVDRLILDKMNELRSKPKLGYKEPGQWLDIRNVIHNMRLIKSKSEQVLMARAGRISADAHKRAMKFAAKQRKDGELLTEWQLEAEIHHEFAMQGAKHPAYGTIVGAGENACILHYTENCDDVKQGDLILIDSGCELEGYAADITRTFPANGKFSDEQKAIYQIVLDAQLAVLDAIGPNACLKSINEISIRVITEGLVQLGILEGNTDELIKKNAHRAYYMHGLGHWLGLDVHDVGDYNQAGAQRSFEPGMVFTIEPGIYIDSDSNCDPKWHGIGVRIEDNILITKTGYENLTASVPKTIEDIEALMA
jgi:Xaa-Pro aminopeptidase